MIQMDMRLMTHLQFFAKGKGRRDPAFHSFNLGKMDVVDPWNTAPGAGKGLVVEVPVVTYRQGWDCGAGARSTARSAVAG